MSIKHYLRSWQKHISQIFHGNDKPFIYVAMGDSTVEGIGATHPNRSYTGIIAQSLKNSNNIVEYHNLGKAGATLHEMIRGQVEKAISLNPDLITISIGANDIKRRTRLGLFEKEIDRLLKKLKEETAAEIVINTIPDLSLTPRVPKAIKHLTKFMAQRINKRIAENAKRHNVILVDLYAQSKVFADNFPETLSSDGFHPSDMGYAIWANSVLTHMQHILQKKRGIQLNLTPKN